MSTESSPSPDWTNLQKSDSPPGQWNQLWNIASHNSKPEYQSDKQPPEVIWANWEKLQVAHLPRPHTPYFGRSVYVEKGDVQSALVKLKGILTINAVRPSHVRDERHEKKGEKRNRLKSQRWRRRFAHEVRKKVQLVNEIRARGA
ncbi:hypothetical protein L226DRAFT_566517 [Lentinus tigrinus ALCF2SS1-7]|uniref:Ribosomal protein S21 n=1 Tax=Lentinus tigrinus ALCF2SS1-6 TaxID=1328759 RepID=A0A5C2SRK0_9APHY|nr:hypothetical protein L227DRAFT_597380 [Lentinus tigrinus ALCF2SS1-6]RPD79972.1 hypothetical protein L226DRAFT_566517 [Lentinus tigrinus ALCF2SS1-7]